MEIQEYKGKFYVQGYTQYTIYPWNINIIHKNIEKLIEVKKS